ncbi:MAG TPA: DUF4199 domain-containing protein [Cyclobacteriaceae bacterium]|nr:DUF4199 domain-containing protein [Cyclobacteriaceae bacterium]
MKLALYKYRSWIGEIYGTYVTLGLIIFFMACYWLGYVHVRELRLLNFPIMLAGIYYGLKQWRATHGELSYWKAITLGTYMGGISALTFATFLFVLFGIDKRLYIEVVKEAPLGEYMNLFIATSAVALEGVFAGMMATYIVCNFIDTDKE